MDKKSQAIHQALNDAECAQQVYDALFHVPIDNLKNMRDMILNILENGNCEGKP